MWRMFKFRNRLIEWQLGPWTLWWWHHKSRDEHFDCWCHFAGFGPFQFHWYGTENW